jgi:phosphoglycolate phosphatase-like HAD superfamily hydrolase
VTSGLAAVAQKVLGEQAQLFVSIYGHENGAKNSLMRALSDNAIFITDTTVDVARCREYGLTVIAVGWGYDSLDALRQAGPDFLVESQAQLEALLGDLKLLTVM